jgi:hypothetical protein
MVIVCFKRIVSREELLSGPIISTSTFSTGCVFNIVHCLVVQKWNLKSFYLLFSYFSNPFNNLTILWIVTLIPSSSTPAVGFHCSVPFFSNIKWNILRVCGKVSEITLIFRAICCLHVYMD